AAQRRPRHLILLETARENVAEDDLAPLNELRRALDAGELGNEGIQTALRLGGGSAAEVKRILFRPPPREDDGSAARGPALAGSGMRAQRVSPGPAASSVARVLPHATRTACAPKGYVLGALGPRTADPKDGTVRTRTGSAHRNSAHERSHPSTRVATS